MIVFYSILKRAGILPAAAFVMFATTTCVFGAAGDLDTSYDPNPSYYVYCAAVQPDGQLIVGGDFGNVGGISRSHIARISASGVLDAVFNPGANKSVRSIAVQPDGKIIFGGAFTTIAGGTRSFVARLNADGSLDTGFNTSITGSGTLSDGVIALAIQPDGKIIVGGVFTAVSGVTRNNIARLNADGTLDTGFNPNANDSVTCMTVRADSKIFIGGLFTSIGGLSTGRLALLNADGTVALRPNANSNVWTLAAQSDGKTVIGGDFTTVNSVTRNRLARLNTDGSTDTAFNPNLNASPGGVVVQTNGQMVVVGNFTTVGGVTRNHAARLNSDGTLDAAFNPNCGADVGSAALQADGKIIMLSPVGSVGGVTRNWIARLLNDSPTESLTVSSSGTVQWLRGGSAPEAAAVTFELSTDGGSTWAMLGAGTRIAGGWNITGVTAGRGTIRARARTAGGEGNGSAGLLETQAAFDFPPTLTLVAMFSNNANSSLAKPGDTLTLFFTSNEAIQTPSVTMAGHAATVVNQVDNTWTATATVVSGDSQGPAALSVAFQDLAGNSGTTVTALTSGNSVTIDTVAPASPSVPTMTAATDSGIVGDGITNNTTPVFTGTAEPDATVRLYDSDGTTLLGTGTATSGNYTIASAVLTAGSHTITAKATDAAGNTGAASVGSTAVIMTAAPAAPSTPDLVAASDSGVSSSDNITKNTTPTIIGTAPSGTTVTLYDTNGVTVLGTCLVSGGVWSIATTPLNSGAHILTAKATDVAGNVSLASGNLVVTIDTAAPALSPVTIASNNAVGGSTRARLGDTITLSFTSSETVQAPTATIAGRSASVANPGGNNWTATITVVSGVPQGTVAFSVTATDIAGNTTTRTTTTNGSSVTVDTVSPVAPVVLSLASASDTGFSNTDRITNLTVLTITGSAESGATVKLFSSVNGQVGSATATGGNWSITASALSPNNTHLFTASATDAAGNTGPVSTELEIVVDTTAATLVPVGISTNNSTPSMAHPGDTLTLAIESSEAIQPPSVTLLGRAATVSGSGTSWTASVTVGAGDPQGVALFSIVANDLAGNIASRSTTTDGSSVFVDTVSPVVTPPANVTVHATSPGGAVVTYSPATASDTAGVVFLTYSHQTGSIFPIGITTVIATAKDAANNTGTADFTVTVTPLTPTETWRYSKFGNTGNTDEAADNADPNGNGIANLMEYALNGDPIGNTTGNGILPIVSANAANHLQLAFTRYLDRSDITLTVQGCDTLADAWTDLAQSSNGTAFIVLAPGASVNEVGTGNARTVTVGDLYQISDSTHPQRFLRLKVTRP